MKRPAKAPRWQAPFLRALARTGNVRLAAEQVGVDFSSAYYRRKRDAGFAGDWAEALRQAQDRLLRQAQDGLLRRAGEGAGADRSRHFRHGVQGEAIQMRERDASARAGSRRFAPRDDGEVRGVADGASAGGALRDGNGSSGALVMRRERGRGKMVRAGAGRWSAKAEEAFFAELIESANVRRAAEAAGFSTTAIYNRRRGDAAFAARWEAVAAIARERIDMMLLQSALAALDPGIAVPDGVPKASIGEAIAILKLRGGGGGGAGREALRQAQGGFPEPDVEAVRTEVLRRIAAIRRGREGQP